MNGSILSTVSAPTYLRLMDMLISAELKGPKKHIHHNHRHHHNYPYVHLQSRRNHVANLRLLHNRVRVTFP